MDWNRLGLFDHNEKIPLSPFERGNRIAASFKHSLRSEFFELQSICLKAYWGNSPLQGGQGGFVVEVKEGDFKMDKAEFPFPA